MAQTIGVVPATKKRRKPVPGLRVLMPSAGSGGSSGHRHHGGGSPAPVSPGISDFGGRGGGRSTSTGGAPSVTIPSSAGGGGAGGAYIPPAVSSQVSPTTAAIAAATRAYEQQQNLLQKYILEQTKDDLINQQVKFNKKGEAVGFKETPRQIGEDLHTAAQRIKQADYRSAGLSQNAKDYIQKQNAQGKTVGVKRISKMSYGIPGVTKTPKVPSQSQAGVAGPSTPGYKPPQTLLGGAATRSGSLGGPIRRKNVATSKGYPGLYGRYPSNLEFGLMLASAPFPEVGAAVKAVEGARAVEAGTEAVRATSGVAKAVDVGKTAVRATKIPKALQKGGRAISTKLSEGGPAGAFGARVGEKAATRIAAGTSKGAKGIYGASVAASAPSSGQAKNPLDIPKSLYLGTERAITAHPGETLATTGRALPAVLTFPASVLYESGKAATTGNTSGLQTLGEEAKGFVTHTGGELISGDPSQVQQAIQKEIGLSFLVPLPRILGGERGTAVRAAARGKVARLTEHLPERLQVSPESPRGIRRRVAVESRRVERRAEIESAHFKKEVVKPLRKVKGKEMIDGVTVTPGDTIHLVAKYGISREDPMRVISRLKDRLPKESAGKGVVTASQALTFLERHPEVLKNKNYWKAVDAAKASGEATLTSPRAKYMGIGDLHGVVRPEERVPVKARELTSAKTRDEAWNDVKERTATAKKLRSQAHDDSVRASALKGPEAAKLRVHAKEARKRAQELDSSAKALRKALSPFTRPGHSLEGTRRNYDTASLKEYQREVKAKVAQHGHEEPAHLPQVTIGHRGAGEVSRRFATGAKAPHIAAMDELSHQHIDNSLRSLVAGGIERPRIQKSWHEFLKRFVATERQKIGGKSVITREEFERAIRDKEINPKHYVLLPSRDYHQAIKERFTFTGALSDDLRERIDAINQEHVLMHDKAGMKYVVVHREAAEELKSMLEQPGVVEKVLNANAKLWNRILLGLSPGWELSQIVAEGIPIGIAHPEIPLKAPKFAHAYNKLTESEARAYAGLAGESPRIIDQPEQLRPTLPENANKDVGNFVRATSRNPILRGMWSTARARPLGLFDRWRTGKYRSVLMTAELNRDLNGFVRGLRGSLHFSKETAAKLRNMPLHEQMAFLGKHPSEAKKLMDYTDDVMGNWDAFTRFERQFAPALIFYPFVRYSLRWTFWSFPMRHPIKAQMLYFLGQMNAQELEKLLGAKPQNWTDYANPVIYDQSGPSGVMPFGRRIAPGLSAPVEAAGSGNVAGLLGALNPTLGIPIEALTGVNPLSGQQEATSIEEKGWLALNQLLSMPAPLRLMGLKAGPKSASSVSQAFSNIDPNRQLRSALMPYLPLSAERYKLQNTLDKLLTESGGKPGFSDFLAALESGDRAKVKELISQYKLSSKAADALDAILPSQPGEDAALSKAGKLMNRLQFGPPEKPKPSTSSASPFGATPLFGKGSGGGLFGSGGIFDTGGTQKSKPAKPLQSVLKGVAKNKKTSVSPSQITGPLSSDQKTFASTLAKQTGLSPKVTAAWTLAEGGNASGDHNYLNVGVTDSGPLPLTAAAGWSDPASAANLTAQFIKGQWGGASSGIQNIASAVGKPDATQLQTIAGSGWATNPAYASLLSGTYQEVGVSGKTKGQPYVNPFGRNIQIGRTDMGIDPSGPGPIRTLGKAKYLGTGGSGWPTEGGSGTGPVYKLLKGPAKGKRVYTYEGITPRTDLKRGDILKKGEVIARSTGSSFETGFAQGRAASFQPLASPHYSEGDVTPEGQAFLNLVQSTQGGGTYIDPGTTFGTSTSGAAAPTGTPYSAAPTSGMVSTAKTSVTHSDELSATQKLRLIKVLNQPGGALKLLGIPGAFTQRGSLTTDGAKMLAQLSADRLRLLSS